MRILALSGSLRRDSLNTRLLRAAQELGGPGVEFVQYDSLATIPPFNQELEHRQPAGVHELRQRIEAADAVLIATPEYNGSIPGQLKNALDWVSRPLADSPFRGKPTAVIGASTSTYGAMTAVGWPRNGLSASGRETQSSAFLSKPGMEPLYSGVAISTASAASIRWRSSCTSAGWRCSSSWLNGGIVARLSYRMNSTPGPPSSCAARRSRVLSESRRRLPDRARMRMSGLLHGREAGRQANGVSEQEAARRKR